MKTGKRKGGMYRRIAPPEASTPSDHPDGEQESDNTVIIADRKGVAFRDTLLNMFEISCNF